MRYFSGWKDLLQVNRCHGYTPSLVLCGTSLYIEDHRLQSISDGPESAFVCGQDDVFAFPSDTSHRGDEDGSADTKTF